jgi:hypothetical protein
MGWRPIPGSLTALNRPRPSLSIPEMVAILTVGRWPNGFIILKYLPVPNGILSLRSLRPSAQSLAFALLCAERQTPNVPPLRGALSAFILAADLQSDIWLESKWLSFYERTKHQTRQRAAQTDRGKQVPTENDPRSLSAGR